MIRSSRSRSNKRSVKGEGRRAKGQPPLRIPPYALHPTSFAPNACVALMTLAVYLFAAGFGSAEAAAREPVTMRVVAVNPSAEKSRTVPVRIDLPQEITPADVLDRGEMDLEFDTERSLYYVNKPEVQLAPKQTKVFEVVVRDVWYIPDEELEGLKGHTNLMLGRLENSEYYPFAKQLSASILERLDGIEQVQNDDTIGRRARIGMYRTNTQTLKVVKEDLARMEKLLSFTGGPPVPEMMKESPLKSDAPSTTTTWLVIFLVITFMGLLAGQFFFTWQRRVKAMSEFSGAADFPGVGGSPEAQAGATADGRGEQPAERPSPS